jgi:hypothetical protein
MRAIRETSLVIPVPNRGEQLVRLPLQGARMAFLMSLNSEDHQKSPDTQDQLDRAQQSAQFTKATCNE